MKVALVHDWLVNAGGAEKALWQFHLIFPDAPIYTLVYDSNCGNGMFKDCDVRTTWLQKIPMATKLYKNMLMLMPNAWEQLDLTEYDLVLSSCSSCAKGVITRPDAVHICYCHTPTRYVWDFYYTYLKNAGWLKRKIMPFFIHKMKIWDQLAANRVDCFIANSNYIAQRIKKYYRRDAITIYSPVHIPGDIRDYPIVEHPKDYYLVVSRLVYYKRIDLAIQACNQLGRKLIIIGAGEEEKKLRKMAGPTIQFLGKLSDNEVVQYYLSARAFLFPGEEDYGLTPLEAQSAGCPVIAFGKGGALETVLNDETGIFFEEQAPASLAECILKFEEKGVSFTRQKIREHGLSFNEGRFREEILGVCKQMLK